VHWRAVSFAGGTAGPSLRRSSGDVLPRLAALGLPTPPGFTLSVEDRPADATAADVAAAMWCDVVERLSAVERATGRRLGDPDQPLLLAVRVGAPDVPGRTNTILNLGLDAPVLAALVEREGERFAAELELRFLRSFAAVVHGVPESSAPRADDPAAAAAAVRDDLDARGLPPVPDAPPDQLRAALRAAWDRYDDEAGRRFRRVADPTSGDAAVTAVTVTVQAMALGNRDDGRSGSGVAFSRDPSTGSPDPRGDFRRGAQGVGTGGAGDEPQQLDVLRAGLPDQADALNVALALVETELRDACEVDFTVEAGELSILRARPARRSRLAAVRIAVDLVDEGLLDVAAALDRIPTSAMARLQRPVLARGQALDVVGRGTAASPGIAVGRIALDPATALDLVDDGDPVVLVRPETTPADLGAMLECVAVVTEQGGHASHAAVVARGLGRPAVCGVDELWVDARRGRATVGDRELAAGDTVTVDGTTGMVVAGAARLVPALPDLRVARVLAWAAERQGPPIGPAPADAVVVRAPDRVPRDRSAVVVVEEDPDVADPATLLRRTAEAVVVAGVTARYLRLPDPSVPADLRPPDVGWDGLVADPGSWAAQLVAGRLRPRRG